MTPEEKRELLKRSIEEDALESADPQERRSALKRLMLSQPTQDKDFSAVESFALGAARSAPFELADEGYGAYEAGRGVFSGEFKPSDIKENYRAGRQKAREYLRESAEQNPVATFGGAVAGGAASGAILPFEKFSKAGKYVPAAVTGGLYGYGASESDNPLVQVEDTAKGAALGPVLQKGFELLPGRAALAEKLKERAAEKAVKSSGAMTKEYRQLQKNKMLRTQGDYLLDKKIVTPLASLEQIAERSGEARRSAGEVIGGIIDKADGLRSRAAQMLYSEAKTPQHQRQAKVLAKQLDDSFGYSLSNVADRINQIMQRDRAVAPSVAYHFPKLAKLADAFGSIGSSTSLRVGLRNKTEFRRLMKDVDSLDEQYKQEVYDIVSDELERAVSKIPQLESGVKNLADKLSYQPQTVVSSAKQIGKSDALPAVMDRGTSPKASVMSEEANDIVNRWRSANRDYAGAAVAQKTAESRLGTVRSNRDYGLTTALATNAGMLAGGAPMAVAMGAFNNFMRKYGSTLQATGYRKIANMLESNPDSFGKYRPQLQQALQKGVNQFVLNNYLIAKSDPEYVSFLEKILEGEK